MKRQVLQGLALMLICFLLGGAYIIYAVGEATGDLERAVTMHRTGDTIRELQRGIENIQLTLLQHGVPEQKHLELIKTDIVGLKEAIRNCFKCDYSNDVISRLDQLQIATERYTGLLGEMITLSPVALEDEGLKENILIQGTELGYFVESFIKMTSYELSGRSKTIYRDITKVRHLIIFLVIVGPIAILIITAYFLNRFTGSVGILVEATNALKNGDLGYHIKEDLKYEFKELADSFNSMSLSLKNQRDNLQTVQKLYKTLFESANDGIFILDLDEDQRGQIVAANRASAVMHGYSVAELLKMRIHDISCDGACPKRLEGALGGEWAQYVVERTRKDGSVFLAEVNVGLLDMSEEQYALVFSRDVTRRKKEEAELQRANQMALVGEMAAGLAHEIKNPLAGIKVTLEVLADELLLSEEDQDLFTRVINETKRVEKLLKGLLSYARPPKLQYSFFDLNKLLDNAIKNMFIAGRTSSSQEVEFEKHYAENLPQLEADSAQLQQVILNVFLNAIEAMADGGCITVSTHLHNEEAIEMRIADTGKGVPTEGLAAIFQPFHTTKSKGTGLGLAICKRIIEEHGGTIAASASPIGGMLISIILPLKHKSQDILL